jgi:hypothetical protein
LNSIDIFSAHNEQFVGHFTVLRNVASINEIGFKMQGWQELCLATTTQLVEEHLLPKAIASNSSIRVFQPERFSAELKRPFARFGITFGFEGEVAFLDAPEIPLIKWENGHVYYIGNNGKQCEALYIHFMGFKRWWHWLCLTKKAITSNSHCFSRLGYGSIASPSALFCFPFRQLYKAQEFLFKAKYLGGVLFRALLPSSQFHKLRRILLGRGRY